MIARLAYQIADYDAITTPQLETFGRAWTEESRQYIPAVCTDDDGTPIASAVLHISKFYEDQASLWAVCTRPSYQRRGAATACIQVLIDLARERGRSHIWLDAEPGAVAFYLRLGFDYETPDERNQTHPRMAMRLEENA